MSKAVITVEGERKARKTPPFRINTGKIQMILKKMILIFPSNILEEIVTDADM